MINDDPQRTIEFDPEDLNFIDGFYELIGEFEAKEAEYSKRAEELQSDEQLDGYGIPKNMKAVITLAKEVCEYMKEKVDQVFGDGTSEKAFGKAMALDMFGQFFDGVTPYISSARDSKIEKYTGNRAQRRADGKKVMK